MEIERELVNQFHIDWLYHFVHGMDDVRGDLEFNIQYTEINVDFENPPVFTFFAENCGLFDVFCWLGMFSRYLFNEDEWEYVEADLNEVVE